MLELLYWLNLYLDLDLRSCFKVDFVFQQTRRERQVDWREQIFIDPLDVIKYKTKHDLWYHIKAATLIDTIDIMLRDDGNFGSVFVIHFKV